MNALHTLRVLAGGARPVNGLLHNCRFEGLGVETFGIEAVVERLRMGPFEIAADAHIVETPRHIAVFDGERALFADLYDGNIARLWILGRDSFGGNEPLLDVPFDPDLSQGGGDVLVAGPDHPDLASDAALHVEVAGRMIVAQADGPRARAFAIRAFGSPDEGAALFAVFRLRLDSKDVAGFHLTAARWDGDSTYIVRDFGSEATLAARRWTPRIDA